MKKLFFMIMVFLVPIGLFAQIITGMDAEEAAKIMAQPHFLVAIIAGVIIALGIQLLLTNLSIASGVSAFGSLDKKYNDSKNDTNDDNHDNRRTIDKVHETARTITAGFGAWALITSSIALFFASWLAVELSLTISTTAGLVIGLTIWGLFFIIAAILEYTALSSLSGSLMNTAFATVRTARDSVKSLFSKSDESKVRDQAEEITHAVMREFEKNVDTKGMRKQLQAWIDELQPQRIELKDIRKEIEKLFNETDIDLISESGGPIISAEEVEARIRSGGKSNAENAKNIYDKINSAVEEIRNEREKGKSKVDSAADAGMRMAGISDEKAVEIKSKLKEYLQSTENEQLDPDAIKEDLERLFEDPKGGYHSLMQRVSSIDKDTVVKFITALDGMTEDQVRNYIGKVETAIDKIKGSPDQAKEGEDSHLNKAQSITEQKKEEYKSKLYHLIDNRTPDAMDIDKWLDDFEMLFHDPKRGFDNIIKDLKAIDRPTLIELISLNSKMSADEAEEMVAKIERKRDEVIAKYEELKSEVNKRIEDAKREAVHQAEELRKTSAVAAWWVFGMAMVSGVAAAIGGMLGAGV